MNAGARPSRPARVLAVANGGILVGSLLNAAFVAVNPGWVLLLLLVLAAGGVTTTLGLMVIAALSKTARLQRLGWLAVGLVLTIVAPLIALRLQWPLERMAYGRTIRRSAPIIAAIEHYSKDNGHPPPTLDAVVPTYLDRIPGTGLPAFPVFEYEVPKDGYVELFWYDLGDRHGLPMRGLWAYPDGPPSHAILGIEFDRDGRRIDARVDRMPAGIVATPFDEQRWRRDREGRMAMVPSLQVLLSGTTAAQTVALLGEPDGRRLLTDTPWELRVPCPHGVLNWDVLLYWPTGSYPRHTHGGWAERIGDWAYIHE